MVVFHGRMQGSCISHIRELIFLFPGVKKLCGSSELHRQDCRNPIYWTTIGCNPRTWDCSQVTPTLPPWKLFCLLRWSLPGVPSLSLFPALRCWEPLILVLALALTWIIHCWSHCLFYHMVVAASFYKWRNKEQESSLRVQYHTWFYDKGRGVKQDTES